jgi:Na+/proline symporter
MNPLLTVSLIIGYFVLLVFISLLTGKQSDNETFFRGNRQSKWYVVAIGMIGASLSGVTFVSVPGWVGTTGFTYLQMVLGYLVGYVVIANVLLPLYYRMNLTSIYSYLEHRFGKWSYRSGAMLFLLSKTVGGAARLYLMATVLQLALFDALNIPFGVTVLVTIGLIWLYTFRGGVKTVIWTDMVQTILMVSAVILSFFLVIQTMEISFSEAIRLISDSSLSRVFVFDDWASRQNFWKQFLSGAFITIVMTGLDQDMMQKNLTCKTLRESQKNMYWYGFAFLPVNLIFLSLGAMLYLFAAHQQIPLPARADDLFPMLATQGFLPPFVGVLFVLGLIAAAYSSADSALTSLTTSFSVDFLNIQSMEEKRAIKIRRWVHVGFSLVMAGVIIIFRVMKQDTIISTIFTLAGYTYGPLLGLYAYGLFTKMKPRDWVIPFVAVLSPLITGVVDYHSQSWFGAPMGYEKLLLNGAIAFFLVFISSLWRKPEIMKHADSERLAD